MAPPSASFVTDYYRAVASVLLPHLAGRPLRALSSAAGGPDGTGPIATPTTTEHLLALVSAGAITLLTAPAGRMVLHLAPGDGADIATVATAVLQLAERCASDGLRAVPLTDGAAGLWLIAGTDGDGGAAAGRYAEQLSRTAPELATLDPAQSDGRSLVTLYPDTTGLDVPVPYTLLVGSPASGSDPYGAAGPAAAIPLHLDEIAAITAGMPAELIAADVVDRIATRGDLAGSLLATA